jgi:putative transposase
LTEVERAAVLEVLHSERFADMAPATIYATLLDEGVYLCSEATHVPAAARARGETGDRRRQATHPAKVKAERIADAPSRVWSWDITKLHGPAK